MEENDNYISTENLFMILKNDLTIQDIEDCLGIPPQLKTVHIPDVPFVKHQCFLALLKRGEIKETDIFHVRTKSFLTNQTEVFVFDKAYRGKELLRYTPNGEWEVFV